MKLNGLKQLVKEELERALNKVKVKVDYITAERDGGPGIDGSTTEQIDQADYDKYKDNLLSSFWRGIAQEAADERIYKIEKVTKL